MTPSPFARATWGSPPPPPPGEEDVRAKRWQDMELRPRRHPGQWLGGLAILVVFLLLVRAFSNSEINWGLVPEYLFDPRILEGLGKTVLLTVISLAAGTVIGAIVAGLRLSSNRVAAWLAWFYVWVFRGTPELLQLLIWFNLALIFPTLSFFGFGEVRTVDVITPFVAATLAFSINTGAYIAENFRGAILAVDSGQAEAASALGISSRTTFLRITLPQAMRAVIPSIGNNAIALLKFSSLASAISYTELLGQAQRIYFTTGAVMELLFTIAVWYLVATSVAAVLQYYVERRFGRSERNRKPDPLVRVLRRLLEQMGAGGR